MPSSIFFPRSAKAPDNSAMTPILMTPGSADTAREGETNRAETAATERILFMRPPKWSAMLLDRAPPRGDRVPEMRGARVFRPGLQRHTVLASFLVTNRDRDPRGAAEAGLRLELRRARDQRRRIGGAAHAPHVEESVAGCGADGRADDEARLRAARGIGERDGLTRLVVGARNHPALLGGAEQGLRRDHGVSADHVDDYRRRVREDAGLVLRAVREGVVARGRRAEGHHSVEAAADGGSRRGRRQFD